jgi:hypothetical protein
MNENGRMYGMLVASLKLFRGDILADGRVVPSAYQPAAVTAFDLLRYADLEQVIGLYQAGRGSLPSTISVAGPPVISGTPSNIISFLLANGFDGPQNNDSLTLSIRKRNGIAPLSLLPYALEQRDHGIYGLYVYDPDSPGDQTRVIMIDSIADTWFYSSAGQPIPGYEGDATSGSIFLRSLEQDTSLPRSCNVCGSSAAATDAVAYTLNGQGRFLITNNAGQRVGYDPVANAYVNEIPGATMDFIEAGSNLDLPPLIRVPLNDSYTTALFSSPEATGGGDPIAMTITAPGMVAGLRDLHLSDSSDPAQFQLEYASRQIGFQANSLDNRTLNLDLAIEQADGTSYSFMLSGVTLADGQSVTMGYSLGDGTLKLSDTDSGRTQRYDLTVKRVEVGGVSQTIQRNDIPNGTGAGAAIDLGSWDGVHWPTTSVLRFLLALPLVQG